MLLLGTYHFSNPGLDLVKTELDDHLSSKRQSEIEEVRLTLAQFKPTVVALEWPKLDRDELSVRYQSYLSGSEKPAANERVQIGFELAKRMNLTSVEAIDYKSDMDFDGLFAFGKQHGLEAEIGTLMSMAGEVGQATEKTQKERTVGEILRLYNSREYEDLTNAFYLRLLDFTAGTESKGSEVVAEWYRRNLIMMSYIRSVAKKPEDRVLVILGASHVAFMRDQWRSSLDIEIVDPKEFLPLEK
ncbi:MAG: DUF5694 domain-containing protein [Fimbriimonadaceae bacterium]